MESVTQKGLSPDTKKEITRHGPEMVISNRENMAKMAQNPVFASALLEEANLIRKEFNLK